MENLMGILSSLLSPQRQCSCNAVVGVFLVLSARLDGLMQTRL
jgi:hypothetical protein